MEKLFVLQTSVYNYYIHSVKKILQEWHGKPRTFKLQMAASLFKLNKVGYSISKTVVLLNRKKKNVINYFYMCRSWAANSQSVKWVVICFCYLRAIYMF